MIAKTERIPQRAMQKKVYSVKWSLWKIDFHQMIEKKTRISPNRRWKTRISSNGPWKKQISPTGFRKKKEFHQGAEQKKKKTHEFRQMITKNT